MATYSALTDAEMARILEQYGVTAQSHAPLAGGAANSSFRVKANGRQYVLTVLDNRSNLPIEELAALLTLLDQNGIRASAPVLSRANKAIESVDGRAVMLKPFVEGTCYDVLPETHLAAAGSALARAHRVPPPSSLPQGSRRLTPEARLWLERFDDRAFAQWVAETAQRTAPAMSGDLPAGLVHGDYFADNLVIDSKGDVAILDWETASRDALLVDLGFAAVGLCRVEGQWVPARLRAFLEGYESLRPLVERERTGLRAAIHCAAAVLGFHRYLRHCVRHPNPACADLYKEMPRFVESVEKYPTLV